MKEYISYQGFSLWLIVYGLFILLTPAKLDLLVFSVVSIIIGFFEYLEYEQKIEEGRIEYRMLEIQSRHKIRRKKE